MTHRTLNLCHPGTEKDVRRQWLAGVPMESGAGTVDRYAHMPTVALVVIQCDGGRAVTISWPPSKRKRPRSGCAATLAIAAIVAALFALMTIL